MRNGIGDHAGRDRTRSRNGLTVLQVVVTRAGWIAGACLSAVAAVASRLLLGRRRLVLSVIRSAGGLRKLL